MNTLAFPNDLLRCFIGADHFNRLLSQPAFTYSNYPPYNIEQIGENKYVLTLAVAGFSANDIDLSLKENTLVVSGKKETKAESETQTFLHRGLSFREFERKFALADHMEVVNADLTNGMLTVSLERKVPEIAVKKIAITSNAPALEAPVSTTTIEGKKEKKAA